MDNESPIRKTIDDLEPIDLWRIEISRVSKDIFIHHILKPLVYYYKENIPMEFLEYSLPHISNVCKVLRQFCPTIPPHIKDFLISKAKKLGLTPWATLWLYDELPNEYSTESNIFKHQITQGAESLSYLSSLVSPPKWALQELFNNFHWYAIDRYLSKCKSSRRIVEQYADLLTKRAAENPVEAIKWVGFKLPKKALRLCMKKASATAFKYLYPMANPFLKRELTKAYLQKRLHLSSNTVLGFLVSKKYKIYPEFHMEVVEKGLIRVLAHISKDKITIGRHRIKTLDEFRTYWYKRNSRRKLKNLNSVLSYMCSVLRVAEAARFSNHTLLKCFRIFLGLLNVRALGFYKPLLDIEMDEIAWSLFRTSRMNYLKHLRMLKPLVRLVYYYYKGKVSNYMEWWCTKQYPALAYELSYLYSDSMPTFTYNNEQTPLGVKVESCYPYCPEHKVMPYSKANESLMTLVVENEELAKSLLPIATQILFKVRDKAPPWVLYTAFRYGDINHLNRLLQILKPHTWHQYWEYIDSSVLHRVPLKFVPRQCIYQYLSEHHSEFTYGIFSDRTIRKEVLKMIARFRCLSDNINGISRDMQYGGPPDIMEQITKRCIELQRKEEGRITNWCIWFSLGTIADSGGSRELMIKILKERYLEQLRHDCEEIAC